MANELEPSGWFDATRLIRSWRRRSSQASAADAHSGAVIGVGAVIVAVGGAIMATAAPVGLAFLGAGLIVAALGLFLNLRKRRSNSQEQREPQPIPVTAVSQTRPDDPPLSVQFLPDTTFRGRGSSAMIAAAHILIENMTDKTVRVVGCRFSYDNEGRLPWEHYANEKDKGEFYDDLERRRELQVFGPPLEMPAWVDAHGRTSGWILESVTRTAAGGTPACAILIVDDLGNSYEAKFSAGEPKIYPFKN